MNLFDSYKIKNHIRLIELFGGIGSQAMALRDIGADFTHWRLVEFCKYAVASYNAIHGTNFEPTDIKNVKGEDLGIVDTQNFTYILTYSFPCQDLSLAGKQRGMTKGSGTRSCLLWEVERLLNETENLPQVLLMENVPQVHGTKNIDDFNLWIDFLKSKGYSNFWQDLNAKDYGVAQNRKRCFMVSVLGNEIYEFPKPVKLNKCIKDYLEDEVDEKYYIKSEKAYKLILDLQERGILEGKDKLVCDSTINNPKEREVMNTITSHYDGGIRNIQAVDGAVVEKVQSNIAVQKDNFLLGVDVWNKKPLKDGVCGTLTVSGNTSFSHCGTFGIIEKAKTAGDRMAESKSNEIIVIGKMDHTLDNTLESANRVYSKDGICPTIPTCAGGNIQPKIIDELKIIVAMRGRNPENPSDRTTGAKTEQRLEPNGDGVCNTLTSVQKDNLLLEEKPECINLYDGQGKETSFQDRVYKTDKISPAITTSFRPNYAVEHNYTDSEKIKIKQATKQGYIECKAGGVADFSYPESKLRRDRVQGGGDVSPTLTSSNLGVCKVESRYRIRKLTPKECWRLMGFSDEDFEKAAKVNSNTQLYKQAGNSIVKDVLMAIFRQMID